MTKAYEYIYAALEQRARTFSGERPTVALISGHFSTENAIISIASFSL